MHAFLVESTFRGVFKDLELRVEGKPVDTPSGDLPAVDMEAGFDGLRPASIDDVKEHAVARATRRISPD